MRMSNLESSKINAIIFDLDGTLIDSAAAILEGLEYAIKKARLVPQLPLTSSLIGPPLKDTFRKLIGKEDGVDLDDLISSFKCFYDQEGFKKSRPYPGVEKILRDLKDLELTLYLATNKRFVPTQRIVNYFGWDHFFDEIYTIDKFANFPFEDKASMLQALLKEKSIEPNNAIYIGDREEDLWASIKNNLTAILVTWGYGDFKRMNSGNIIYLSSPEELISIIRGKK